MPATSGPAVDRADTAAPIWTQAPGAALTGLAARMEGLADSEAQRRLAHYGPNRLGEQPPRAPWRLFAEQFRSLLVLVLLAAALLAGAIGDLRDTLVILAVTVCNATLGFYQEFRAERSLAALRQMLASRARVRRDGQQREIAAAQLVPGDIVLLEAGDKVPADGRLLVAHNLEAVEAALTGESQPLAKSTAAVAADTPLAERSAMLFMNTVVTRGRAELLVSATGMATEMGRITGLLEQAQEAPTPLQQELDRLGRRLALIAAVVAVLIMALGLLRGEALNELLLTSLALAVAAIPEGLPAVVTVTLALGMRRMARQRAILKKLAAVETLGCTTVICSDKTGTLTMNQMTARALWFRGREYQVSGEGYRPQGRISCAGQPLAAGELDELLLPLLLCNDARVAAGELIGDPTEGALLVLAAKAGLDGAQWQTRLPRLA